MSAPPIDIDKLSRAERLNLLERLWESLGRDAEGLPLTDAQARELDRRLDRLERDGPTGVPWEDVLQEMESQKS